MKHKHIIAAGGVVFRIEHEVVSILLIFRNGVWDLPKGKLEKGESIEMCASREVSEETGTLSLANQGKLERPITSSRLQELLVNLIGNQNSIGTSKSSLSKNSSSQKTNPSDIIISEINEKDYNKSEIVTNKKE